VERDHDPSAEGAASFHALDDRLEGDDKIRRKGGQSALVRPSCVGSIGIRFPFSAPRSFAGRCSGPNLQHQHAARRASISRESRTWRPRL
jgi:hypothetical protein